MDTQYKYHRKSIRLKGFDYSSNGMYFVTICTHDREYLFGDIVDGKMVLNQNGKIGGSVWESLPEHHPVELDQFQIMPNHIHMVIIITDNSQHTPLGNIIAYFKYQSTKLINNVGVGYSDPRKGRENPAPTEFRKIFQRNYFEHIIRNEIELFKIREYIRLNPGMWDRDRNNPKNSLFKNVKIKI